MMRLLVAGLTLAVLGVVALSAYLLLAACGLRLPFLGALSVCPTAAQMRTWDALDRADRANRDLERRIGYLERELAALQCEAAPPPPPSPPPPPEPEPEPLPEPPPPPEPEPVPEPQTESGLAPGAFDDGDVAVMEGCWELVTEFTVREQRTGRVDVFRNFEVCFDASGNGRQIKQSTTGVRCEGSVQARIDYGTLVLTEPADMRCSNGMIIYRAITNCTLDATGRATCRGLQPEVNARSELFILRRKGRR